MCSIKVSYINIRILFLSGHSQPVRFQVKKIIWCMLCHPVEMLSLNFNSLYSIKT